MPQMNTDRHTRDECGRRGWEIWKVESYNSYTRRSIDLFNLFDYLAMVPKEGLLVGIQSTTRAEMGRHEHKMRKEYGKQLEMWLSCNCAAVLWGWYIGIEPPQKVAGKTNTYRKPPGKHHGNQTVFLHEEELVLRQCKS